MRRPVAANAEPVLSCRKSGTRNHRAWIPHRALHRAGELQRLGILIADAHTGSVYDLNTEDGALYVGLGAHFAVRYRRKILEQMERGSQ